MPDPSLETDPDLGELIALIDAMETPMQALWARLGAFFRGAAAPPGALAASIAGH